MTKSYIYISQDGVLTHKAVSSIPPYKKHSTFMLNTTDSARYYFDSVNASSTVTWVIVPALVLLASGTFALSSPNRKHRVPTLGGLSIFNAWDFFVRRWDFLQSNFKRTGQQMFSFSVLQVSPIPHVYVYRFFSDPYSSTK